MWFYKYGAVLVQGSAKLRNSFNFQSLVCLGWESAHACDPMSAAQRQPEADSGENENLELKVHFWWYLRRGAGIHASFKAAQELIRKLTAADDSWKIE